MLSEQYRDVIVTFYIIFQRVVSRGLEPVILLISVSATLSLSQGLLPEDALIRGRGWPEVSVVFPRGEEGVVLLPRDTFRVQPVVLVFVVRPC